MFNYPTSVETTVSLADKVIMNATEGWSKLICNARTVSSWAILAVKMSMKCRDVSRTRDVKRSLNFRISILKLEFKFDLHTFGIRILD